MNKIVFLHYRNKDNAGQISARGGATVAIQQTDTGEIRTAVAWCSDKDNYNKATGRGFAGGRLMFGKHYTTQLLPNIGETVLHVDDFMYLNYGFRRHSKQKRKAS